MKRLIVLLLFILTGCAASEQPPGYMMRLGSSYAWRCGGVAIDEHHIISAEHCGEMTKAQTGDGIAVDVQLMATWPEIDTALYQTDERIELDTYATLQAIEPDKLAYAFGYCPLWKPSAARFAQYVDTETQPLACHDLHIAGAWICSGDSGGIVEQDGNVVGMISEFRGTPLKAQSRIFAYATCAIPGDVIQAKVDEWRSER